jgi:putative drug exporter of the RND superfamily
VSSFLFGLARAAYRRRVAVLVAWLAALILLGAFAALAGGKFDEKFSLPGTESQTALDSLNRTFPQVGGTSAQVVVIPPTGTSVRSADVRKAIQASVKVFDKIDQVGSATSPFDEFAKGLIADDNSAAIISVRLDAGNGQILDPTFAAMAAETTHLQAAIPGSTTSVGGEAYNDNRPGLSLVDGVGVVVALIVLLLTLGSLRAAGMPLLTALLGVGITMILIFAATGFTTVSTTTPLLALMLGLAVGIDYALFIVSRHRDQLAEGLDPEESIARAVATAGSAVVFAGLTVMIALTGLSVARIPFLTTMGVAAAVGVAVAVMIALTLLPALLGFAGDKLRPKPKRVKPPKVVPVRRAASSRIGLRRRWVRIVTKIPALTIVIVIAALGTMAYPAKDLRIALPSNGTADPGTNARVTYDLIDDHFGVGYNGPLIVSATIVSSDDPLGVMDGIADEIRGLPGVASVPLSTPNADASTGIVQVIPTTGPDTPETKALVMKIRSMKQHFQDKYGVPVYVTGFTAVAIDVSDRLGKALLPFGLVVVGLSLVLLTMVFRSIAVPLKATIGYLLSVGASFGATAVVFEWGWFSSFFNVNQTAPVISFLPILLMGILFGLAMDYEVFLVSRIREDFVHHGDARAAIENGFAASAKVVVAAAVIMFAVFSAFVPEGEGPIKTISFGLAVGVFVDAFLVRMTLVPAVLSLLGKSAWWIPKWIDKRLPSFDVEGEGLAHQLLLANWPTADDHHLIYADGLRFGDQGPVRVQLAPGQVMIIDGPDAAVNDATLLTLSGRMRLAAGRAKVAGLVLPEQAGAVRRQTAVINALALDDLRRELRDAAEAKIIFVAHADALTSHDDRAAIASLLEEVVIGHANRAVVLSVASRDSVADLLPGSASYVTVAADLNLAHRS